ncbi:hypothetical protein FRC0360_00737 [Corynebacterium diphtheriae]|nr:hypothetical protein FRC0360_00737 [Corynebacterium diphtheriae]
MTKNWLSYDDQVALLNQRGMHIEDDQAAAEFLSRVSYYRLSGYFRHWQRDPNTGTTVSLRARRLRKLEISTRPNKS